jgi:Na+-transporting NADH:ubiquinone oxidoreductase subunit C
MRDTIGKTFGVAGGLCLVCSVLVSTAAVVLRDAQQLNKKLDVQANILKVAGIYEEGDDIESVFRSRVETLLVDLRSGMSLKFDSLQDEDREITEFERRATLDKLNISNYDPRKAAKNPELSVAADGLAQISSREPMAFVYLIKANNAKEGDPPTQIVLPIYGKGLWSTLYGFIALEPDMVTVRGITFYEHGETPGLGGEVDNEAWKASWRGKRVYDLAKGDAVKLGVVKNASGDFEVDALSGATITSNGVTNLVQYWLGPNAFGPYLASQRFAGSKPSKNEVAKIQPDHKNTDEKHAVDSDSNKGDR